MEVNYLNLTDKEIDLPIHRVITIQRLFQLFHDKLNVLVNPKKWDDPFENYMMNSVIQFKSGIKVSIGFKENLYGQCWTRTRESDAMWRIYSPDKNGVRISSTPRKLLNDLKEISVNSKNIDCFIGKVKYYSTPKLKKLLQENSHWLIDETGVGPAQTLLFKRLALKHENEVRLIYNSFGRFNKDMMKYEAEPLKFIDDIVFDPRISYAEFSKHKEQLLKLDFKKRIVKSIFYQIPDLTVYV